MTSSRYSSKCHCLPHVILTVVTLLILVASFKVLAPPSISPEQLPEQKIVEIITSLLSAKHGLAGSDANSIDTILDGLEGWCKSRPISVVTSNKKRTDRKLIKYLEVFREFYIPELRSRYTAQLDIAAHTAFGAGRQLQALEDIDVLISCLYVTSLPGKNLPFAISRALIIPDRSSLKAVRTLSKLMLIEDSLDFSEQSAGFGFGADQASTLQPLLDETIMLDPSHYYGRVSHAKLQSALFKNKHSIQQCYSDKENIDNRTALIESAVDTLLAAFTDHAKSICPEATIVDISGGIDTANVSFLYEGIGITKHWGAKRAQMAVAYVVYANNLLDCFNWKFVPAIHKADADSAQAHVLKNKKPAIRFSSVMESLIPSLQSELRQIEDEPEMLYRSYITILEFYALCLHLSQLHGVDTLELNPQRIRDLLTKSARTFQNKIVASQENGDLRRTDIDVISTYLSKSPLLREIPEGRDLARKMRER